VNDRGAERLPFFVFLFSLVLRFWFWFSRHVETNSHGEIQSSVSPAGNQHNPFYTAPKAMQKLHDKIQKRLTKRFEDRQVLRLRLENLQRDLDETNQHLASAIRNWQEHGNAKALHMKLMKAQFAIKGFSENLGE